MEIATAPPEHDLREENEAALLLALFEGSVEEDLADEGLLLDVSSFFEVSL